MLARYGGVETAKRLIANSMATSITPAGFTTLFLCGRPDLTMEHSVCKPEYRELFTADEIRYCNALLGQK